LHRGRQRLILALFASFLGLLLPCSQIVSVIIFTSDQGVEVLEKDSVVALRLIEDRLAHCRIQILEQRKDFPQRECDSLLLKPRLEDTSIDSLLQQQARFSTFQLIFLLLTTLLWLIISCTRNLAQLFNKSLFELLQL
jgi:hypothetical protein